MKFRRHRPFRRKPHRFTSTFLRKGSQRRGSRGRNRGYAPKRRHSRRKMRFGATRRKRHKRLRFYPNRKMRPRANKRHRTIGGKVKSPHKKRKKGYHLSAATRRKISLALKGKHHHHKGHRLSKATREKISRKLRGRHHHHKGHKLSAATRKKISDTLRREARQRRARARRRH